MPTRDDLARLVLTAIAEREDEIASRARPKKWQVWSVQQDEADREHGPLYTPQWFGELSEARRTRILRTVKRLEEAGLIECHRSEAGRLQRVRLTEAGRQAVLEGVKP